jgi:hypothetical protein
MFVILLGKKQNLYAWVIKCLNLQPAIRCNAKKSAVYVWQQRT